MAIARVLSIEFTAVPYEARFIHRVQCSIGETKHAIGTRDMVTVSWSTAKSSRSPEKFITMIANHSRAGSAPNNDTQGKKRSIFWRWDRRSLKRTDRIRRVGWCAPFLVFVYTLIFKGCLLDGWPGWYYALQRLLAETLIALEIADRRLRGITKA